MDDDKKPKSKKLLILAAILGVLLLFVGIGLIQFLKDTNEMKERVKNGEFDEYHNQPNNEFGAPVVYYKSDLDRIVGVELRESETDIAGYSCTKYWNNRNTPTKFDDLRFYIFLNEDIAKKALKEIKENTFREITDEGDNYVRGWVADVMDADIENYYYVNGNLMVVTTVTSVSEMARDIDDPEPPVYGGGDEAEELIKLIKDNF